MGFSQESFIGIFTLFAFHKNLKPQMELIFNKYLKDLKQLPLYSIISVLQIELRKKVTKENSETLCIETEIELRCLRDVV